MENNNLKKFYIFAVIFIVGGILIAGIAGSISSSNNSKEETESTTSISSYHSLKEDISLDNEKNEQTENSQYHLPNETKLTQTYNNELSKITNYTTLSCQYENYNRDDDIVEVDAIVNMSDGKTVQIDCMYSYSTEDWSIISIKNNSNQHIYQIPEDFKFSEDIYNYDSDKLIPKKKFRKKYKLKNISFYAPFSWTKKKSQNGYTFSSSDSLNRNISILYTKDLSISVDKLWESLKTNFSNYSLIKEENIKIDNKKGTKWYFSFSMNGKNFEAIYTLIKNSSYVYCLANIQQDYINNWMYNEILKTIKWEK